MLNFISAQAVDILAKKHNHTHTPIGDLPHYDGVQTISKAGERTLWIVFAIMAITTVLFGIFTSQQPKKMRLYPGNLTTLITTFAAISYFAMATRTGAAMVPANGHHAVREIFWARYADWAVTTPLLLLDLALFAGLPFVDILTLIVADVGMILTGLFAALDPHLKTRFGFYTFSCLFFLYVLYVLLISGTKTAYNRHDKVGKAYLGIAVVHTAILWLCYPIVWVFGEGLAAISPDTEVLLYAILDVTAKPGFGILLFALHASIPASNVALSSYWTEPQGAASGGYGAVSQNES